MPKRSTRGGATTREFQFDGLVGPTHNYGALSAGNVASTMHGGEASNPRAAAIEGLAKMRFVRDLGVAQAVLPPQVRPSLSTLRRLGFRGRDEDVIAAAAAGDGLALRLCSSASAMWAANAATVVPSADASDGQVHLVVANLQQMFHRSIEAPATARTLRAIFRDKKRFTVHSALPGGGQFADEGAANHIRLATSRGTAHVFAWGRVAWEQPAGGAEGSLAAPRFHPARQTREASVALSRLHRLAPSACVFPQQHPAGIDAGAFHTDVMAVGTNSFLMLHELAFAEGRRFVDELKRLLGEELVVVVATSRELPAEEAVAAYPFNSQVLPLTDGTLVILAPEDAREAPRARAFLERVAREGTVSAIHFVDVRQSMRNGGGPACLRLRVPLTSAEARALPPNVVLSDAVHDALAAWIERHYRDRLVPADLADSALAVEGMRALDELTGILGLGSLYDFQRG